jgi:hypothetical protein
MGVGRRGRHGSSNSELQETLFRRPTLRDRRDAYIVSETYPLGGTAGSVVPSCVFGVRNLRGMAKGEQDARRGSVFDL